jgi:hypothetical protein
MINRHTRRQFKKVAAITGMSPSDLQRMTKRHTFTLELRSHSRKIALVPRASLPRP